MSFLPTFLHPVRKVKGIEVLNQRIPEGERWNTLSNVVLKWPALDGEESYRYPNKEAGGLTTGLGMDIL